MPFATSGQATVVMNGEAWAMDASEAMWTSPDGLNWTQALQTGSVPGGANTLQAYNGEIWDIDASQSDWQPSLFRIADGAAGSRFISSNPGFTKFYGSSLTEFHGRLWRIGGADSANGGYSGNEVWYTK